MNSWSLHVEGEKVTSHSTTVRRAHRSSRSPGVCSQGSQVYRDLLSLSRKDCDRIVGPSKRSRFIETLILEFIVDLSGKSVSQKDPLEFILLVNTFNKSLFCLLIAIITFLLFLFICNNIAYLRNHGILILSNFV
jgi:hypothetical protein